MPFVPENLSDDEKTLLATITAQTIRLRDPKTAAERAAAESEAEQTAAELIWAQRGEMTPEDQEPDEPMEGWLAEYYGHLAAMAAADRSTFDDEEDPEGPRTAPGDGRNG
jgi:hypothetical protein